MQLIDGKKIASDLQQEIAGAAADLRVTPGLAVVLIGEDPASQVYVRNKVRAAGKLGFQSWKHVLGADATQQQVLDLVAQLNADPAVHGILVQSPPPSHIDERAIVDAIDPRKDVDCFHPVNVGKLLIGDTDGFLPCTPAGVMVLLERSGIETSGKQAVVLGRSNIVGKPMALLLARKGVDCTVTICHSRTRDLARVCRQADLVVAAIGKAEFLTADMVKDGAVVIDVGINRIADPAARKGTRLAGDVAYAEVAPKCSWITPVPGGVGPMTIAMLMQNTLTACRRQCSV